MATHRTLAERTVKQIFSTLPAGSPTRQRPLPGGEGPARPAEPLWSRHGSDASLIHAIDRETPAFARIAHFWALNWPTRYGSRRP